MIKRLCLAKMERKPLKNRNTYECPVCGQRIKTIDICEYKFCHGCGKNMICNLSRVDERDIVKPYLNKLKDKLVSIVSTIDLAKRCGVLLVINLIHDNIKDLENGNKTT